MWTLEMPVRSYLQRFSAFQHNAEDRGFAGSLTLAGCRQCRRALATEQGFPDNTQQQMETLN